MSLLEEIRVSHVVRPVAFNQDVKALSPKPSVDPWFLTYALLACRERLQKAVHQAGHGTGVLATERLTGLEIPLPPLDEQRRIAEVLSALDDLIDTNKGLAADCANLAGLLWRKAVVGLVPSVSLSERASIVLGGTPSRKHPEYWGGDVPWVNSGQANEFRVIEPSEYITKLGLEKSSTKLMPAGTTVIAITGATLGQVSRMEIAACGNQSLVGVYSMDAALNDHLFFAILDQIEVLVRSATGGAQQHVNKANVEELLVKWPAEEDMHAWHSVAAPLIGATANLLFEADELTKVRDELLPLLMSGKVRVRPEGVSA
jgi:type I restriction enzyme S subunit